MYEKLLHVYGVGNQGFNNPLVGDLLVHQLFENENPATTGSVCLPDYAFLLVKSTEGHIL